MTRRYTPKSQIFVCFHSYKLHTCLKANILSLHEQRTWINIVSKNKKNINNYRNNVEPCFGDHRNRGKPWDLDGRIPRTFLLSVSFNVILLPTVPATTPFSGTNPWEISELVFTRCPPWATKLHSRGKVVQTF